MESFYLPVEKFFLRDFFQIISIFEYLEIELNWHLEKIISILIYKLFSVLECDRKELKKEAFEIKKEFNLPLQFSEIICKKIKRIVFSENFYDEDFLEYNLFPLLTKEYTIEYLDNNLFFYTHPDIETCLSVKNYRNSTLFFNIHFFFFEFFPLPNMLFFSHNTDYFLINASKNLFIDNIYEIIISSVHITDKIHNLLENVVFKN
ncbi:hypothetical protein CWI37_1085p0010 [Hamiltosporidium tvaerminnensis]|uniref:Uncharacterized protein n=1 Tax=Hamiltosporidium tvaerminnensis TaxID=1176355 RepID=A0A4Q9KYV9_9MICR|nr:hypothetical protein CWI37_1085p0010 [Hamiltosporidium tvaerminnensis]